MVLIDGLFDAEEGDKRAVDSHGMVRSYHLKTLLVENADLDVTYKRQIGETAIISGFYGKDIIYKKAVRVEDPDSTGGTCINLVIKYPAQDKEAYDELVKKVSNSFGPIELEYGN